MPPRYTPIQKGQPYVVIFGDGTDGRALDEKPPYYNKEKGEHYKKLMIYLSPESIYYLQIRDKEEIPELPQDNFDRVIFGNGTLGRVLEVSDPYFHYERREIVINIKVWLTTELMRFEKLFMYDTNRKLKLFFKEDPFGKPYVTMTYPSRYFVRGNNNAVARSFFILCGFNNQNTSLLDYFRAKLDELGEKEIMEEDLRMSITKLLEENDKLRRRINEVVNERELISRKIKPREEIFEHPREL